MATQSTKASRLGIGCLMLFALPFVAAGMGMAWWTARTMWRHEAAQAWVEVPAVIRHVELKQSRGKNNATFKALANYEYEFGGRRFKGERVSIHDGSDNLGSFQRDAYNELKLHLDQKKPFRCFVDPKRPSESVLYRDLRWEMAAFSTSFATVLGAIGFGLLTGAIIGSRQLSAKKPEQTSTAPWLARADWAMGKINATGGAAVAVPILAVVTLWWILASLPLMLQLPSTLRDAGTRWAWIMLAFPVIGLSLLFAFAYQAVRRRKFGESVLQLAATPGVVGGQLAGVVRIPTTLPTTDGYRIKLNCIEQAVKRGGDQYENLLWQDERLVLEPMHDDVAGATAIPVLFAIPYDARETSRGKSRRDIEWWLEVSAKMPGVDYAARFEVPVFKTAESRRDFRIDEHLAANFATAPPHDLLLREAGILREPLAGGGLRFMFPAARNRGSAVLATSLLLIWGVAIWLMVYFGLPIVFPIAFGLIGLLIFWAAVDLWLYRSVAEATRDGLTVRGGLMGIGRQHYFAAGDIRRFKPEEYMSSGTRRWTSIYVVPRSGGKRLVAKGISSRLAQQAIIDELNAALGTGGKERAG